MQGYNSYPSYSQQYATPPHPNKHHFAKGVVAGGAGTLLGVAAVGTAMNYKANGGWERR